MEKVIINFSVENDTGIYQIVNFLVNNFPEVKDLTVFYKDKVWIFSNLEKVKYFLKNNYFDFEKNQEIKVKEL